ncbi:MAG: ADOP family duplicated permease [Acidobacteriota bacterium]
MGSLVSDIRWSLRLFRRRPTFAATVVITLAIAIAAVAAAYGVATSVLWRPLPFRDSDQLVFVWENGGEQGAIEPSRVTGYRFDQWERGATRLESIARFGAVGFLADQGSGTVIAKGVRVSTNYFETLGISPMLGRTFTRSDGEPGADLVVILSHALWQEWYGGRRDAIGKLVRLGDRPYTIIGVMPPVVFPAWPVNPAIVTLDPESRRLWVPITRTPGLAANARSHVFGVVARLKPGTSVNEAAEELSRMARPSDPDRHRAVLRPFREQFVRGARAPLIALFAAACAVLLVACTNLAALQASAAEGRRAELSVRAALGAGRLRLARQFATEAFILAASAGGLGLLISRMVLIRVPELLPPSVPLLTRPSANLDLLLLVIGLSLGAAGALAVWPLVRAPRSVSIAPRGAVPLSRSVLFRSLVVAQVALAMALVAVAALLQQSLDIVRDQDAGFVIDRVLVGNLTFASSGYANPKQVVAAERRLAADLGRLPGARGVAFAYDHPLEANWINSFVISGTDAGRDELRGSAQLRIVSPGYFDTMGVAVLDGRAFSERDDLDAGGAVVVNEAFARTLADGPVLNRVLRSDTPGLNWSDQRLPSEFRVIGIVEDERFNGLEQPSEPAVYMSTRQFPQQQLTILIRTNVEPAALASAVRQTVRAFDPHVPVSNISALSSILAEQLVTRSVTTHVIDGFAAGGLALAGLGLYGLLALLVSARLRETGIRLALGSSPSQEARRVVRECLVSTGVGLAAGIGLALVSGRLAQSLLVGVSPRDVATLGTVSVTMLAVAAIAASIPAWRAARVDPALVLRAEL